MESEKPAGEAIAIINAKIVRMVAFISVMVEMIRKDLILKVEVTVFAE